MLRGVGEVVHPLYLLNHKPSQSNKPRLEKIFSAQYHSSGCPSTLESTEIVISLAQSPDPVTTTVQWFGLFSQCPQSHHLVNQSLDLNTNILKRATTFTLRYGVCKPAIKDFVLKFRLCCSFSIACNVDWESEKQLKA